LAGASSNALISSTGDSLLCAAARAGQFGLCQVLLQFGAVQEFRNASNGETPLIAAAKNGHIQIVQLLCRFGTQVDLICRHTLLVDDDREQQEQ
jgi:ankyrin repeat protein